MTIIAFDISKTELIGVRVNQRANVQESYAIPNEVGSIAAFLDAAAVRHSRLTVASEATAEYHRPLAEACLVRQISFRLINPIVTKQLTRVTIRKKKTDLSDAFLIAKAALQGAGTLITAETLDPAKTILRTAMKLGQLSGALLRMERYLNVVVSEDGVLQNTLRLLREQTEAARKEICRVGVDRLDSRLIELLSSVPGIGPTLAPVFIAELMPITRFPTQKGLVAYAGLDPRVKQSGVSLKRNTHLTKRGSPSLRRAAYIAASIAQRHDLELKQYYEKKRAEGKRYREATIANARHILARVAAVWRRGTPYVKRERSTTNT